MKKLTMQAMPYGIPALEKRLVALEELLAVQIRKDATARRALEEAAGCLVHYGQLAGRFNKEKAQRMFKLASELREIGETE